MGSGLQHSWPFPSPVTILSQQWGPWKKLSFIFLSILLFEYLAAIEIDALRQYFY